MNTPTQLVGPLHRALLEDVEWAKGVAGEEAVGWGTGRALMLGRLMGVEGGLGRPKGEVWVRWEEEQYADEAEWVQRWPVPWKRKEGVDDTEAVREGHVAVLMCLTWEGVQRAVKRIEAMLKET